jgi:2,4-dienoyl-CoA reductase (NADPH2)
MTTPVRLTGPWPVAGRTSRSRVLFGPHETNLGEGRALSDRHTAYYARRARGGAGIVVTETASVHESDWPYERSPLARHCEPGWTAVTAACHPHGTLVLAGLGHTGAQGSSAFGQQALWAPSAVADVASREMPMVMESTEIDELVASFAAAAGLARRAGCDGVELDAGPGALLRQFHSGLTNLRSDDYGRDRLRLTREVLVAVRAELGDGVLALRLSCDELAPWAGVTPELAAGQVGELAGLIDLLVVTRGGPFSASAYRPDGHQPPGFNRELCAMIRPALDGVPGRAVQVVLQGSVVDPGQAQDVLDAGVAEAVEMTRALIADADLVAKVAAGHPERVRPCVLCNQTCRVRDNRNPIVTCVLDPQSGYESQDTDPEPSDARPVAGGPEVLVVGAGPAGLEAARVLAGHGRPVRLAERAAAGGGALTSVARLPGRDRFDLARDWWLAECARLGVRLEPGGEVDGGALDTGPGAAQGEVLLAIGGRTAPPRWPVADGAVVVSGDELLASGVDLTGWPAGPVAVVDEVGGPVAVGVAELLAAAGRPVHLVTADLIAGTLLAMAGDLADANVRLERAGVRRHTARRVRRAEPGSLELADTFSAARTELACAVVVHCGHRLPAGEPSPQWPGTLRAGDAVAPRSVGEAVLEGRRAALVLLGLSGSDAAASAPVAGAGVG